MQAPSTAEEVLPNPDSTVTRQPWWATFLGTRWLLGIGTLLFLGSLYLQVRREHKPHNADSLNSVSEWMLSIAKELGGVLVVGVIVRTLIDEAQQKNWQDTLSRKVTRALQPAIKQVRDLNEDLGSTLRNKLIIQNEAAKKLLDEKVLRPTFIRKNYQLTLTISDRAGSDHLDISIETYYIVENVGNQSAKYPIYGWIDTIQDQWMTDVEPAHFTSLAFGPKDLEGQDACRPINFAEAESKHLLRLERAALNVSLHYDVNPELTPHSEYFIRLCATQSNRSHDQFVWNMAYVTQDLRVVIKLEGNLNWGNFEVIPRLMHHEDNFTTIPERPTTEGDQSARIWWLNTVLLPYQGVQIWWFPSLIETEIT